MAREESRILKNLLREVYLLLLALLAFVNFFIPAMIHTVSSRDRVRARDRVWVRVVPANPLHETLDLGRDVGLFLADDDGAVDCFTDAARPNLGVGWELLGPSGSLLLQHEGQKLRIGAWLAELPNDPAARPAFPAEVRAPVRLVVYPEREAAEVDEEVRGGALRPGRLVLTLGPGNGYQDEKPLPDEMRSAPPGKKKEGGR